MKKKRNVVLLVIVIVLLISGGLLGHQVFMLRRDSNNFIEELKNGTFGNSSENDSQESGYDLISEIQKKSEYSYKIDYLKKAITIQIQSPDMRSIISGMDLEADKEQVASYIQKELEKSNASCENTITLAIVKNGSKFDIDTSTLQSPEALDALTGNLFSAYVDVYEQYIKSMEDDSE